MATVTAQTLIDRAKSSADIRDNFVTTTEWLQWANQERKALEYLMARSGWTQNTSTLTVTATGAGHYILSEMPLAVCCVHESSSQGFRPLVHNNAVEFKRQAAGSTITTGQALEYSLSFQLVPGTPPTVERLYIDFYPEPASGTYLVTIIPVPSTLVLSSPAAGETVNVVYPMGWEEYIVQGMARRALLKEESDPRGPESLQAEVARDIDRAVWSLVMSETPAIRNVDKKTRGWYRDRDIPPVTGWRWF